MTVSTTGTWTNTREYTIQQTQSWIGTDAQLANGNGRPRVSLGVGGFGKSTDGEYQPRMNDPNLKGKLGGVVTETGTVARRIARVYDRASGLFIGQYVSRADGRYDFGNLNITKMHDVVVIDDISAPVYNDVIAGQVIPVLTGVVLDPNYPPGGVP